jgi:hypothetical protein
MRSRTGVRSHAMSTMDCWRSTTRRQNGRFARRPRTQELPFLWLELRRRTRCRNLLPGRIGETQWTRSRTLSPPGLDPHRRAPDQPDRRTAPLEPRCRRQYRHFRTLFNRLPKCPPKISGHFVDPFSSQNPKTGHWSTGEDHALTLKRPASAV